MASKTRPQFKHPIKPASSNTDDIYFITSNEIMNAVGSDVDVVQVRWRNLDILIRYMISKDEMAELVNGVLSRCIEDDNVYMERVDFETKLAIVVYYTNIQMPTNINSSYKIIYGTDLYETMLDYISSMQVEAIEDSIQKYIH